MKALPLQHFVIVVSLWIVACSASVPLASPEEDAKAKQFQAPANQANLYIIRGKGVAARGVLFPVVLDGAVIGTASPGTYLLVVVAAGEHLVSVNSEYQSKSSTIKVENGRNYFLEVKPEIGFISGGIDLELISEHKGQDLVRNAKRAQLNFFQ